MTTIENPPIPERLRSVGEFFASGYCEMPQASPHRRWSRAFRRQLEHNPITPYSGTRLFPWGHYSGPKNQNYNRLLAPDRDYTWAYNRSLLQSVMDTSDDESVRTSLQRLDEHLMAMDVTFPRGLAFLPKDKQTVHVVGGSGSTHSVPDYVRFSSDGFDAVEAQAMTYLREAEASGDADKVDFYSGVCDVFAGIRAWHQNILDHLSGHQPADEAEAARLRKLREVLTRIPFKPARTFYEAILTHVFVMYLDFCDNPGRLDIELAPYYEPDLAAGRITRAEALELLRELCRIVCDNDTWSATIGGTNPKGSPAFSEVTDLCLEAVIGHHRPNYQLRIRPDMPDSTWGAALDAIAAATGQPALHNEMLYLKSLKNAIPDLTDDDLAWWAGAGCTETLIQGRTNCGSLDAGFNLPWILEQSLHKHLIASPDFESFVSSFEAELVENIAHVTGLLNDIQRDRAIAMPHPMRTILHQDCIERGLDFNAGGARYNWGVLTLAGLANVADSLAALRDVVFSQGFCSKAALLDALKADFAGYDELLARLVRAPKFGNDAQDVDDLAAHVFSTACDEIARHRTYQGSGPYLPSCIIFMGAPAAGMDVGALPDGRRAREPIADSIGPYQGRDKNGPTATIRSVTKLPLHRAIGTPVFNLRIQPSALKSKSGRMRVRSLVEAYFELGGMQLQFSVVDQETLQDAIDNPEQYANLAVRVGGFSGLFTILSPELQQAILARTLHEA